jgi:photosystem II stability/assembly factor-like uncharacterized protein
VKLVLLSLIFAMIVLGLATPEFVQAQEAGTPGPASSSSRATAAPGAGDWLPLGSLGPYGVSAFAVAPAWPNDKTIVAERGSETISTADGGGHWERRGSPPVPFEQLILVGTTPDSRTLLGIHQRDVYRSLDFGKTWKLTLSVQYPDVQVSPNFAVDRVAYVLGGDGTLWRSRDAAGTWQALNVVPDQLVQSYRLSPDFARDDTIVASVVGGGTFLGHDAWAEFPSADPADSNGVMISSDGGDTWTEASGGLEVEGQPYLAIQSVFFSPTFARDGSMFAIGWGDPQPSVQFNGTPGTSMKRALFRSSDRGNTWYVLDVDGPFNYPQLVVFALSPNFAQDGVALWGKNNFAGTPAGGSCEVFRSNDGALTWTSVLQTNAQYSWCGDVGLVAIGWTVFAHIQISYPLAAQWSHDAGQTWSPLELTTYPLGFAAVAGNLFIGYQPVNGTGGLFGLGSDLTPSAAGLPCSEPLAGIFAQVLAQNPDVRNLLGCPLGPVHNAGIRAWADQIVAGSLTLWPDDDSPDFLRLYPTPWANEGVYRHAETSPKPPGGPGFGAPDAIVPGAVQRFEDGSYLVLTRRLRGAGQTIYAVSGDRIWSAFTDTQ